MRPGQQAPESHVPDVGTWEDVAAASMRPGQQAPESGLGYSDKSRRRRRFNEARAASPGIQAHHGPRGVGDTGFNEARAASPGIPHPDLH